MRRQHDEGLRLPSANTVRPPQTIARVAIVGTGVIGASWATAFLARGMDVTASDPAPGAEDVLRRTVAAQWPVMEAIGLSPGASKDRLHFAASPEEVVLRQKQHSDALHALVGLAFDNEGNMIVASTQKVYRLPMGIKGYSVF